MIYLLWNITSSNKSLKLCDSKFIYRCFGQDNEYFFATTKSILLYIIHFYVILTKFIIYIRLTNDQTLKK